MAVTALDGFEDKSPVGSGYSLSGAASYDTSIVRTGLVSVRCNPASAAIGDINGLAFAAGRYGHFGMYVAALPSVVRECMGNGASNINLRLNSTGTLEVRNGATVLGTSTTALVTGRWYWIGVRCATGTNVEFLQIDGSNEGVVATATVAGATALLGFGSAEASAVDVYFDDIIEDDANFLGPSKVALLLPISDNGAHTGWQAGNSGATNLWDAVNNTPPAGVASADETDTTNIEAIANTGGTYTANLTTYNAVGIQPQDTVLAVRAFVSHGEDIATGTKIGTFGAFTNPTITGTAFTFGADSGAHGIDTSPSNWRAGRGTLTTSPTVTLTTSPTMAVVRPNEARVGCVDFMGAYVAWTPSAAAARPVPIRVASQAVTRAAVW